MAGVIRDPSLQGNKELFLLHSCEFQRAVRFGRSDDAAQGGETFRRTSEWQKLFRFIHSHINLHRVSVSSWRLLM